MLGSKHMCAVFMFLHIPHFQSDFTDCVFTLISARVRDIAAGYEISKTSHTLRNLVLLEKQTDLPALLSFLL